MAVTDLSWIPVNGPAKAKVAVLSLARPEAANAFSAELMTELTAHLKGLAKDPDLRAMILTGKGKHFSAGADLGWMKASATLTQDENKRDAKNLIDLFEALYNMPVPTIAVIKGAAYGGAVGLAACCDYAVAAEGARFCLSEVKLGLMPAVILPYLARKIQAGQLRRLGLSARVFGAAEAAEFGLVQRVCSEDELTEVLKDELSLILQCSPQAQRELKILQHQLMLTGNAQSDLTVQAIAALRTSVSAQAGLKSFFEKTEPPWKIDLSPEFKFVSQEHK